MLPIPLKEDSTNVSSSIIRILLYFDIFNHPLKREEIFAMLSLPDACAEAFNGELKLLVAENIVTDLNGYYTIYSSNDCVRKRIDGELRAVKMFKKSKRFSSLIAAFPFVRTVCISGSLSKNVMDKEADVDYFIITAKNRVWVTRMLLILFKKIFLLNSKKYFCVNYFIAEDALDIREKNIYTATEIATLMPVFNYEGYAEFMEKNNWYRSFYPNYPLRSDERKVNGMLQGVKRMSEKLLSGKVGEKVDDLFFRITLRHWKKKFKNFDEQSFDLRLRSLKTESKHHPRGFQEKVLARFDEQVRRFEDEHRMEICA